MNKKKKVYILVIVFVIVLLLVGSTFAYIIWNSNDSQRTDVVFTVDSNFSCRADVGGDISSNDAKIKPTTVSDKTKDNYIKREVKVNPILNLLDNGVYMRLWLDINELGSELSKSNNFMYSLTTSSNSNTEGVVVSGNFNGKKTGDRIILLDNKKYLETTEETYYLWIWLDSNETNISVSKQIFNLSLGGACSEIEKSSIIYNLNGGIHGNNYPTEYINGMETDLVNPTREGYSFYGWYTKADFSGTAISKIPKTQTGDIVLYAKWVDDIAPSAPTTMDYVFADWSRYTQGNVANNIVYVANIQSNPGPSGATDLGSGIAKYQISRDNKTWEDYNYVIVNSQADELYVLASNGTHIRYFRACDNAGNCGPSISRTAIISRS